MLCSEYASHHNNMPTFLTHNFFSYSSSNVQLFLISSFYTYRHRLGFSYFYMTMKRHHEQNHLEKSLLGFCFQFHRVSPWSSRYGAWQHVCKNGTGALFRQQWQGWERRKRRGESAMGFWNLKFQTQWHTSPNKYISTMPSQIVPSTVNQKFKYMSLWDKSYSNHHRLQMLKYVCSFLLSNILALAHGYISQHP